VCVCVCVCVCVYKPGSIGGGAGTQLGGAMGGDTGSWWSLEDGPDSWRPRPAALRDRRIISRSRSLRGGGGAEPVNTEPS